MPKKKLTKSQTNKKLVTIRRAMYDLMLDKMAYAGASYTPQSFNKLKEMYDALARQIKG